MQLSEYSRANIRKGVQELKDVANIMALNIVDSSLASEGKIISSKEFDAVVDAKTRELVLLAKLNRRQFDELFNQYFHEIKNAPISTLPPNLQEILRSGDMLKTGGGIKLTAASALRVKFADIGKRASMKDLGLSVEPTAVKPGISRMLRPQIFDPNKDKSSATFGSAQTLDVAAFRKDEQYRKDMLIVLRDIYKNGREATKEQRLLAEEIRSQGERAVENEMYASRPQDRMTDAGAALYETTRGLIGLLSRAGGALKDKLTDKKLLVEKQIEAVKPAPIIVEKQIEAVKPAPIIVEKQIEAVKPMTAPSYVMSNEEASGAAIEEADEEADEYRQESLELVNKEIEILTEINNNIKNKEGGDSMPSLITGVVAGLTGFLTAGLLTLLRGFATTLLPMIATFLGPLLLPLAGIALVLGAATWLYKKTHENDLDNMSPEDRAAFQEKQDAYTVDKSVEHNIEYYKNGAHAEQLYALHKAGVKVPGIDAIEPVKKEIAATLDKTQAEVETLKEEKSKIASSVSAINAPATNNVVAQKSGYRGKDNPRNSDNSLTLYLNSRVIKFA